MTPSDTLTLLRYIYKSDHSIVEKERSFLNGIELWAKAGKHLTEKQKHRLEEIYRTSQGHYARKWRVR